MDDQRQRYDERVSRRYPGKFFPPNTPLPPPAETKKGSLYREINAAKLWIFTGEHWKDVTDWMFAEEFEMQWPWIDSVSE